MPSDVICSRLEPGGCPPVRPSARPTAGFTVLEALVAVTIVGMTAVASLAAFGSQLQAGARAETAIEAEALAEELLARLRLLPVTSLQVLPDSLRSGTFPSPFEGYRWTSTLGARLHEADLHETTVTVRWEGGEFAVSTRLYRPSREPSR